MKAAKSKATREWFEDLFPIFRTFFDNITPRTTRAEVEALVRYLRLRKGQTFLDCPCGIGRISLPLAERGIKVTGIDITTSYLDELETKALLRDLPVDLHNRDMRKITFRNQFDAAGNLWTSLGYFKTDKEDYEVLKRIYRALKPGGRFLLHIINRDWIIRNFSASGWERSAGVRYFERRSFDFATSHNRSQLTIYSKQQRSKLDMSIRMYSLHELIAIFERLGYVDIKAYGGFHEEPVTLESRMIWLSGRKPKKRA